ncbi:MAG: hypothetical protein IKE30_08505 [Clostridia bacterium]|nr:hypothetical protein [Clostridia bacterium]
MGKNARDRRHIPNLPPVERIELKEKHTAAKLVLAALGIIVLGAALAVALTGMLRVERGWRDIENNGEYGVHLSAEVRLACDLGAGEESPGAQFRRITDCYSRESAYLYRLLDARNLSGDTGNLALLNRHPNEAVRLDEALCEMLEKAETSGRTHYLAPVWDGCLCLFYAENDAEADAWDPARNPELREFNRRAASFAGDASSVSLEFLPDRNVILRVSDEYLAFAEEYGAETFVDFGPVRNAFAADALFDALSREGFDRFIVYSSDGYTRARGDAVPPLTFALSDTTEDGKPRVPAKVQIAPPCAALCWQSVLADSSNPYQYVRADGELRGAFVDLSDGGLRAGAASLFAGSAQCGCADLALALYPLYSCETVDPRAVDALAESGISAALVADHQIHTSDPLLALTEVYGSAVRQE